MEKVTKKELKEMTAFYLKELFDGIPVIDACFKGKALGEFILEKNDDYCEMEDDILNEYLYRPRYVDCGSYGYYANKDFSWMDPENHPYVSINIKTTLANDRVQLTATLLHELAHYYCWYLGYEHHDESRDFLKLCERMHLPTHYTFEWDGHDWKDAYDYGYAKRYMEMYEGRKAA